MDARKIMTGLSVTAILALASPVYALNLGGGAGGGIGGTLSGLGRTGGFASQDAFNNSLDVNRTQAAKHAARKVDSNADVATQAAGTAQAKSQQGEATKSLPAPAKSASPSPTHTSASNPPAAPSKPREATILTGNGEGAATVGNRSISGSGDGSVGAPHSSGSNSIAAAGAASTSSSAN